MKDLFGKALLDYYHNNYTEDIITSTSISGEDVLPLTYLFRNYEEMPSLEQEALKLAKGKVLDVGCGAGNHSLYLQEKGINVKGIDISEGAVEVCRLRGLHQVELKHILDVYESYDTILFLMNGSGIFQELSQVSRYLSHLKSIMNANGQVLIDSSDIQYMYEDDDGGLWIDTNANYYGELDYYLSYKGDDEIPMRWLYLDYDNLKLACDTVGLKCEKILDGEHYDFLARITAS
ncbi:class I SAM-dependent methyltransferase [Psychroserpens sp.]|uniref:class I SAM-dependent methyltransferase n=1 Tax=Psychroserpens sp. TaxID=2020870 RepID=UPI001B032DED|nr:class I SAM-dependent methyltransferase [Psychroserpens sp.]MBO6606153.1 methyltransferase domain-containing protein [Psychroserpens sp.]MBO6631937.1 methyltransferase domain-containing protein [Psychroserpens sp.]MBO6652475.1 methyltransferase domain-containing protein [Psychroserpens sp.]MBO6681753.1 methyltransferase domain-containing protein [Psychroserpens sp.]MBO6749528.1 methyltransferase domain-containing protein [Psychroserpens sp.]